MGWLLITIGLAAIARPHVVWPLSLGVLCLSFAGWRFVLALCLEGVDLTSPESPDA